ncbi:MAG: peptidase M41, partial [Polaribacter sp.]|nr:peptidase M41 [Polaribacter sp.]
DFIYCRKIDKEISKMIEAQYVRAIELLDKNKEKLTILAELLLEKEVIFKDDLQEIFGERPFDEEIEEVITKEEVKTTTVDKISGE